MFSRETASIRSALLVTLAAAVMGGGCARLLASYDLAGNGMLRADDDLRRMLALGHADSALQRVLKPKKKTQVPGDELLLALYEGTVAHYAGDYARSTAAFDRADQLAEDRSIKSITKAALSIMVNDWSLPYEPSRTERLLIPYYAALSFLQAGNPAGAAVEARRLSFLLQNMQDENKAPDPQLHAFLRHFAGVVFQAAGEYEDAQVAYRNAAALDSILYPMPRIDRKSGEVVVLIEHGFAPHRVPESLIVALNDEESHWFDDDDDDRRRHSAGLIAARVLLFANTAEPRTGPPQSRTLVVPASEQKASGKSRHHTEPCDTTGYVDTGDCDDDDDDHSYLLRMSWPVMYLDNRFAPVFQVFADSTAIPVHTRADIGASVYQDFVRELPVIVGRTIARAAVKHAISEGVEKKAKKKDEGLGKLAGVLTNIGGAITEQADLRSWHFVPRSISVTRYSLPPGAHHIRVDGGTGARADLGVVEVEAGQTVVLSTRIWN